MKDKEKKFRHELKYLITSAELAMLQHRIKHLMPLDKHVGEIGSYTIRSLYFDDFQDRCYYENENGVDPREKFRIRIYNGSTDHITLECKRKENWKTLKTSCLLTLEQAKLLMECKFVPDIEKQPALLQKLTMNMMLYRMKPVVIVEYVRIPYVYKNGNVRITLDMQVASSNEIKCFFDKQIPKRHILPTGTHLMEVKYDEFLPDFIFHGLQLENLRQTAFSKFYLCRKFSR